MLPPQILRLIFQHLSICEIYKASRSSKYLYNSLVLSDAAQYTNKQVICRELDIESTLSL